MKKCTKCHNIKMEKQFYRSNRPSGISSWCKECDKQKRDKYYSNSGKLTKAKYIEFLKRECPEKLLFHAAKARAKLGGIHFTINQNDIIIPGACPVFGTTLTSNARRQDNSISLDRINPTLGYNKDNIVVVSWKANRLKNSANINEIKMILEHWYISNIKDDNVLVNKNCKSKLIENARTRARKSKLICTISKSDLCIPIKCPVLDIPIFSGKRYFCDNSPSLDRLNNSIGYVLENIRIISWRANKLKGNATYEEYKQLYDFLF